MQPILQNLSLRAKLTLAMTLAIVVTVTIVSLLGIQREQEVSRINSQQEAQALFKSIKGTLADAFYQVDADSLSETLTELVKNGVLVSARAYDAQGRVLTDALDPNAAFVTETDPVGQRLVNADTIELESQPDKLLAGGTVLLGNQRVGALQIGVSTVALTARVNAFITRGVITSLIVALLALVFAVWFARSITKPLETLVGATQRVASGDFAQTVPVHSQDEIGVLGSTFNTMTAQLRETVTSLDQRVLELRQVQTSLLEQNSYFAALQETSSSLVRHLDLNNLFEAILNRAGELVGTNNGYLFLLNAETNEMVMRVGVGAYQEFVGTRAQMGIALAGKVWQTGDAVAVDDYRNWSGRLADPSRNVLRAVVGVPLKRAPDQRENDDEQVIGILGLAHLEADKRFGLAEMDALERFAALTVIALDNAQLYEPAQRELKERKRAEQELRDSEERYRDLFENANDMIQAVNADGHFLYVNRAWKERLGYSDTEIAQLRFLDIVHPDNRQEGLEESRRLLQGESLSEIRAEFLTVDGRKLFVEGTSTPRIVDGKVISTRGIFRDVTEIRRAEQEVRRIMQGTNAIFWRADVIRLDDGTDEAFHYEWTIHVSNPDAAMHNLPFEIPQGQTYGDALYWATLEEDRAAMDRKSAAAFQERVGGYAQEYRVRDAKGNLHWLYEDARVSYVDDRNFQVVGVTTDVTERKRAQEQMEKQNAYLNALQETSVGLIARLDLDVLLQDLVNRASSLTGSEHGLVYLIDPDGSTISLRYGTGMFKDFIGLKLKRGEGLAGNVWESGALLHIPDYQTWEKGLASLGLFNWHAALAVPIRSGDQVVGVLGLGHTAGTFDEGEVEILQRFGQLASVALVNAQLFQTARTELGERQRAQAEIERQNAYLNALQETSLGLMRRLDVNLLLHDIVARAGALVGTENGYVFLLDPDLNEMELRVGVGAYEGFLGRRTQTGVGLAGQVWETNAPIAVDDYRVWGGRLPDPSRDILRAVAGVPLRSGNEVIGVLGLAYLDDTRKFGASEIQILERFAQLATITLDNARLYENGQEQLMERAIAETQLAKELRETELLNRVTSHAVNLDVDKALVEICRDFAEFFGVPQTEIALLDEERTMLTFVAEHSPKRTTSIVGYQIPVTGNTSLEMLLKTRLPAAYSHAQRDVRLTAIREFMLSRGTVSTLIAPLLVREQVIGTLELDSPEQRDFTDDELRVVESVQLSISTALENARLYQQVQISLASEQQQRRLADALANATAKLVRTLDESEIRRVILDETNELLKPDQISLYEGSNQDQALMLERRPVDELETAFDDYRVNTLIPAEQRADLWRVFSEGKSLYEHSPSPDGVLREHYCLPWFAGDSVAGVIEIYHTARFVTIHPTEQATCQGIVQQAGIAIQNARLFLQTKQEVAERTRAEAALAQQLREIDLLNRVTNHAVSLDVETALAQICRDLGEYFEIPRAGIALLNPERSALTVVAEYQQEGQASALNAVIALEGNLATQQVIEQRAAVAIANAQTDPRMASLHGLMRELGVVSILIAPLLVRDHVIGTIGLDTYAPREFTEGELRLIQSIALAASQALDNAQLYQAAQTELNERQRAQVALARQLSESELLNRVTKHAVNLDVDKALVAICRDLAEYYQVKQAGVALLSQDRQSLTVVAEYSPEGAPDVIGYVIPVQGNPSTEIVMATRQAVAFVDAQTDPRLAAVHGLMQTRGTASLLIAPLIAREEIFGTLGIDSAERREFTEGDVALVQRVAVSISTALENARLYRAAQLEIAERTRAEKETRQRNQELEVISRVSSVLTTNIDMQTALETMARELVRTFNARNCGIALLNPDRQALTVVADALSEGHGEHAVGIVIPVENNPSTQYVLTNRRSLIIPDAQTDPMTEPIHERMKQRHTKCLAIIPLLSGGQVIGTIGLDTTDPNHIFSEEEIRLAETMANQMASAIEKQRLFDQTKERARREQLTREIGADLTRSLDMETIVQTMARELSHALGASHAVVRMGAQEKESNGGNGQT